MVRSNMKIIRLFCAGGASTGMLVQRMKKAAEEQGLDVEISAHAVNKYIDLGPTSDCVLLGPQVGYRSKQIIEELNPIPVEVINSMDYGMMNGEKVLARAMEIMK